jgi:GNAT superfamily N-acetyltransferase
MDTAPQPVFSHVEPVFPVRDIPSTIRYWKETLGFPQHWVWGDPPSNGGVSWQKAFVQFLRHPALAETSKGNSIWIRLHHVEALYAFHQASGAEIVAPLELHAYGMVQYSVKEINGYYVHFAGNPVERDGSAKGRVGDRAVGDYFMRIVERKPSVEEYSRLQESLWGQKESVEVVARILSTATYGVVAEDVTGGDMVGCAFVLSDLAGFYYVKNVMVHPEWQGRSVGTALMKTLMRWVESYASSPSLVGLFARESLEPFYQRFGFLSSFGMVKEIGGSGG